VEVDGLGQQLVRLGRAAPSLILTIRNVFHAEVGHRQQRLRQNLQPALEVEVQLAQPAALCHRHIAGNRPAL
jgi:hypothetical protein